jgi:pSer/pThr/pTyr-binding forkhead associated (FHA) protein
VSAILLLGLRILLAVLLYGFLGYVVYIFMRDLKQQAVILAARQPPPITLESQAIQPAQNKEFARPVVIIGREAGCDFVLDDHTVSLHHARLAYRKQQWWLEDLASTNGTYLNGEAVLIPVVITHGDELTLGNIAVRVEFGQPSHDKTG